MSDGECPRKSVGCPRMWRDVGRRDQVVWSARFGLTNETGIRTQNFLLFVGGKPLGHMSLLKHTRAEWPEGGPR